MQQTDFCKRNRFVGLWWREEHKQTQNWLRGKLGWEVCLYNEGHCTEINHTKDGKQTVLSWPLTCLEDELRKGNLRQVLYFSWQYFALSFRHRQCLSHQLPCSNIEYKYWTSWLCSITMMNVNLWKSLWTMISGTNSFLFKMFCVMIFEHVFFCTIFTWTTSSLLWLPIHELLLDNNNIEQILGYDANHVWHHILSQHGAFC